MNQKKRQYNLSRQEKNYYCMPAVIQAILRRYGREERQADIASEIKCTPKRGAGFDKDLGNFLKKRSLGFQFYWYNEISFNDPEILVEDAFEKEWDIILGCHNRLQQGHIHLAADYSAPDLLVLDPKDLRKYAINLEQLYNSMWKNKFGCFGVIWNRSRF